MPSADQKTPPAGTISTLDSRTVYRNRWMTVREDRILRANGEEGIYGVVEKKRGVTVAAVENGQTYLVEQYRYAVGARFWEFPQGTWEHADVDGATLAAAELREETGLEARSLLHLGQLFYAYGYSTQAYDVFLATDLSQHPPQREAEESDMICRAFPLAEVEAMILDGTIKDAHTVAVFGLLRMRGLI